MHPILKVGLIVVGAVFGAVIAFILVSKKEGNKVERRIGKELLNYAKEKDLLCLNKLSLKISDVIVEIPSILIGNKYIYYIEPLSVKGKINGKDSDAKWLLSTSSGIKHLDNPILKSDFKIQYLADILDIDHKEFINVCVLASGSNLGNFNVTRKNAVIIKEESLIKFIKTTEKVADINVYKSEEVEKVAASLYEEHKKALKFKKRSKRD